jgi:hypothetical protein
MSQRDFTGYWRITHTLVWDKDVSPARGLTADDGS